MAAPEEAGQLAVKLGDNGGRYIGHFRTKHHPKGQSLPPEGGGGVL